MTTETTETKINQIILFKIKQTIKTKKKQKIYSLNKIKQNKTTKLSIISNPESNLKISL